MAESKKTDWRELCSVAANEQDAAKLTRLVNQIIEAFDRAVPRRYSGDSGFANSAD
ncbi:MAG: hypothetical protein WBV46_04170 [Terriglobales bacterium]|jgi:hypothetical protein